MEITHWLRYWLSIKFHLQLPLLLLIKDKIGNLPLELFEAGGGHDGT